LKLWDNDEFPENKPKYGGNLKMGGTPNSSKSLVHKDIFTVGLDVKLYLYVYYYYSIYGLSIG
jgi:hypothetical protein